MQEQVVKRWKEAELENFDLETGKVFLASN